MDIDLDRYYKSELIQVMCNLGINCQGIITTKTSKYYGKTFDIVWSVYWGVSLKVMPINRAYSYTMDHVEISQKSIDNFKSKMVETIPTAIDYFKRQLKANDIIFYNGELWKISFFIEGSDNKNVAIEVIRSLEEWEDFNDTNEFIYTDKLQEAILIDDPLLLLKL